MDIRTVHKIAAERFGDNARVTRAKSRVRDLCERSFITKRTYTLGGHEFKIRKKKPPTAGSVQRSSIAKRAARKISKAERSRTAKETWKHQGAAFRKAFGQHIAKRKAMKEDSGANAEKINDLWNEMERLDRAIAVGPPSARAAAQKRMEQIRKTIKSLSGEGFLSESQTQTRGVLKELTKAVEDLMEQEVIWDAGVEEEPKYIGKLQLARMKFWASGGAHNRDGPLNDIKAALQHIGFKHRSGNMWQRGGMYAVAKPDPEHPIGTIIVGVAVDSRPFFISGWDWRTR